IAAEDRPVAEMAEPEGERPARRGPVKCVVPGTAQVAARVDAEVEEEERKRAERERAEKAAGGSSGGAPLVDPAASVPARPDVQEPVVVAPAQPPSDADDEATNRDEGPPPVVDDERDALVPDDEREAGDL